MLSAVLLRHLFQPTPLSALRSLLLPDQLSGRPLLRRDFMFVDELDAHIVRYVWASFLQLIRCTASPSRPTAATGHRGIGTGSSGCYCEIQIRPGIGQRASRKSDGTSQRWIA